MTMVWILISTDPEQGDSDGLTIEKIVWPWSCFLFLMYVDVEPRNRQERL
jgi:hypothetical protein